MDINRENYEAWLLDQAEGNLSPEQERDLRMFLVENPDLEAGTDLSEMTIPIQEIIFPLKEDLKKSTGARIITKRNYEQFCISRLEGELSGTAATALERFLDNNPDCARTARIYELTRLRPDESVRFPDKDLLRRKEVSRGVIPMYFRRRTLYRAASIAASVVILMTASVFILNQRWFDRSVISPLSHELPDTDIPDTEAGAMGISIPANPEEYDKGVIIESLISSPLILEEQLSTDKEFTREPELHLLATGHLDRRVELDYQRSVIDPSNLAIPGRTLRLITEDERQRGTILNGVLGFLSRTLDDDHDRERLTIWDLADAGVRGINSLAGTDIRLDREYNSSGDLVSMAFDAHIIEIQRSTRFSEE